MSYKVDTIPYFDKELKKLAKKYHSIEKDFASLITSLEENPNQGDSLGNSCYKVRMIISSKGKGKSGGSRVITHFHMSRGTTYLLSIYDKSDKETISHKKIKELLAFIPE